MGSQSKYRARAAEMFGRSLRDLETSIAAMLGEHSKLGRLRSGSTIIAGINLLHTHTSEALAKILTEAGNLIEHRGSEWNHAMQGIQEALDDHWSRAREHVAAPFRVAGLSSSGAADKAVDQRLSQAAIELREQLEDFKDGWTAPRPKLWRDRHAMLYALLLVALGAAVGEGVKRVSVAAPSTEQLGAR